MCVLYGLMPRFAMVRRVFHSHGASRIEAGGLWFERTSTMAFVCLVAALSGCGSRALPFTEAKMTEFETRSHEGGVAFRAGSGSQKADADNDAYQKAEFEAMVLMPLREMHCNFESTVLKALEVEQDNPVLLDPRHLTQAQFWYFVRKPISERHALLRWGAIGQSTFDKLEAAAQGSRKDG